MTRVVSVALFLCVVQALTAQASMTCKRIERMGIISADPRVRISLETYVKTLPRSKVFDPGKPFHIAQLSSRFFLAGPQEEFCKTSGCYYWLLELKDGAVKEVFGFRGTGVVWIGGSPTALWNEDLQDEYSAKAFQTPNKSWIFVDLPRARNAVVVDVQLPEEAKSLQSCAEGAR